MSDVQYNSPLCSHTKHPWIAHSRGPSGDVHLLLDHARGVACLAAEFARCFGMESEAYLCGMWHDAGKAEDSWQEGLWRVIDTDHPSRLPSHSSVGALAARDQDLPDWIVYSMECHHGGLKDCETMELRLDRDRKDRRIQYAIQIAHPLFDPLCRLQDYTTPSSLGVFEEVYGYRSLATRMLHSCLVDADCLDTEQHLSPQRAHARKKPVELEVLWNRMQVSQGELCPTPPVAGSLNFHRHRMYLDALGAAEQEPGFFSLSMPTGAGKTRTGMAFALKHALTHSMRRVIVAIPYTSIIEQTAQVYRSIFGSDNVLEHHSNIAPPQDPQNPTDEERSARLAAQNWDASLIVTTHVQLLESLFACRNSSLRKLHNIAGSVIVLDEIQTLPPRLLISTLHALAGLVDFFGCSIVFCTATQPAFTSDVLLPDPNDDRDPFFDYALERDEVREIISHPAEHFHALRRVQYHILQDPLSWDGICDRISKHHQALVIANTVDDALEIFQRLNLQVTPNLYHLSTRLCGAHRRRVLSQVTQHLSQNEPCVLVSTQVVEAGVDLDFPVVFRATGPLDSIVQAAGRCNREGKLRSEDGLLRPGDVFVFNPEDGHLPPNTYTMATKITQAYFLRKPRSIVWSDPTLFLRYFRLFYRSANPSKHNEPVLDYEYGFDFASAAEAYTLIEDNSISVLVSPHSLDDDDSTLVQKILHEIKAIGLQHWHTRQLQPYLVNIRHTLFDEFVLLGNLTPIDANELLYLLDSDHYDLNVGWTHLQNSDSMIF